MNGEPLERVAYTIEEAAKLLGIGRSTAYVAAHAGEIPTIKISRRLLVPKAALDKMLAEAGQQQNSQSP